MRGLFKGALALGVAAAALATPASASHSWGSYHWARTSNPFTLKLGNNLSSNWQSYLVTSSADWSRSTVLDTTIVAGGVRPRTCKGTSGRIEVCNATYGSNGWLGLASISANGSHITSGTVKLNDTYFNSPSYNAAWRNMVMCQEIGHTFGLDHVNTNFDDPNTGSCMDYTNSPTGGGTNGSLDNEKTNQHDMDQLATIYGHLDSSTTISYGVPMPTIQAEIGDTPKTWGRPVRFLRDGRPDMYVRVDGPGMVTVTHVFWARGEGPKDR